MGHLWQAAGHAAGGMGGAAGPAWRMARRRMMMMPAGAFMMGAGSRGMAGHGMGNGRAGRSRGWQSAMMPSLGAARRWGTKVAAFFFQAEDGIRGLYVTGVQTCALPIFAHRAAEASFALQDVERAGEAFARRERGRHARLGGAAGVQGL